MPLDCGWYYVYDPEVTVDQYDYILQKCLAFDASVSVQTNPLRLADHPEIGPIFDLCAIYERLRLSGLVPPETRALLAEPKREYRLLREPLRLRRTVFEPWQDVAAGEADGLALPIEPQLTGAASRPPAPLRRLARAGRGVLRSGGGPVGSIRQPGEYLGQADNRPRRWLRHDQAGIDQRGGERSGWRIEAQGFVGGRAPSSAPRRPAPYSAGWAACGNRFATDLVLSASAGVGFWLQGDGPGGKFKLQVRDATGATDWYVDNTFTGWRSCQLLRPDKPSPLPVDYTRIRYLMFYYNGLPANTTVSCRIAGVKALPALDTAQLVRPSVRLIGGPTVTFDTTLTAGERLVWFAGEPPVVIGPEQQPRRTLPAVDIVALPATTAATLQFAAPPNADLKLRLVQDNDELLALPEAALATELPGW